MSISPTCLYSTALYRDGITFLPTRLARNAPRHQRLPPPPPALEFVPVHPLLITTTPHFFCDGRRRRRAGVLLFCAFFSQNGPRSSTPVTPSAVALCRLFSDITERYRPLRDPLKQLRFAKHVQEPVLRSVREPTTSRVGTGGALVGGIVAATAVRPR